MFLINGSKFFPTVSLKNSLGLTFLIVSQSYLYFPNSLQGRYILNKTSATAGKLLHNLPNQEDFNFQQESSNLQNNKKQNKNKKDQEKKTMKSQLCTTSPFETWPNRMWYLNKMCFRWFFNYW